MNYLAQNYKRTSPDRWGFLSRYRFHIYDQPVQFIEHTTQVMVIE